MDKGSSINEIMLLEETVSVLFKEAGWDIKQEDCLVVGNTRLRTDLSLYSDNKLVGAVEVKAYKKGIPNERLEGIKYQLQGYKEGFGLEFIILFVNGQSYLFTDKGLLLLAEIPTPYTYKKMIMALDPGSLRTAADREPKHLALSEDFDAVVQEETTNEFLVQQIRILQEMIFGLQSELDELKNGPKKETVPEKAAAEEPQKPQTYEGDEPYAFVSYAHLNTKEVWRILNRLNADGYRVWYDDGIIPGSEWRKNIANHINNCALFIAMMTNDYLESENCTNELYYSNEKRIPQLIVYVNETELPDEVRLVIARKQALFKYGARTEEEFYKKLYLAEGFAGLKR